MFCLIDRTLTDNDVCLSLNDRTYDRLDISTAVLVIRIRIYDDISAKMETSIKTCHKSLGKTFVVLKVYNVIKAQFLGFLNRIIGTSVVNDQIFDLIDTVDMSGKVIPGFLKGLFLIKARYLDYQLHLIGIPPSAICG